MNRTDFIFLFFLIAVVLAIFYPVFFADYLYTDEATQLWYTSKKLNFQTSVPQGRYLTYKIFEWIFSYIHTVHHVIYARLFSLFGWLMCLPVWYFIIKYMAVKNKLSKMTVMLAMIYLISMPPFTIFIAWSACMEMFIACTTSLLAGYLLYNGLKEDIDKKIYLSTTRIVLAAALGIIALFIYQNCFGCFFIPFFIHFIATKKITKIAYIGAAFSLLIMGVYYLIFKYTINIYAVEASTRSALATNPINKLLFLFIGPLATSFNFTFIFNEKSIASLLAYLVIAFSWLFANSFIQKNKSFSEKLVYLLGLIAFAILIYLPSLIVKENYSSNRTLFALDLVVFLLVAETIFSIIKKEWIKYTTVGLLGILFLINAGYNYRKQFLDPVKEEYALLASFINQHFQPGITTIYFISPGENTFKEKYGICSSWDEFGVPSTAKIWVPEPLIKQLIFEKTGDRKLAEKITINTWISYEAFLDSGKSPSKNILFINMQEMLSK
jgi:hypothetical protein